MSNISNRHSVQPFVAGKSEPLSGQRLAKVGYKTTKKNKAKYPSVFVSVPPINSESIVNNMDRLTPHIVAMLENAQDGVIRSLYESSDGALQSVSDDDIAISACIAYLEAENNGSRLTKEMIEQWFDSEVRENLTVLVAEKLGFEELNDTQMQVVTKHVDVYRDILSSVSGGRTILAEQQIKACERALTLAASDDSDVAKKIGARLQSMKTPKPLAELLQLGDD